LAKKLHTVAHLNIKSKGTKKEQQTNIIKAVIMEKICVALFILRDLVVALVLN